MKGRDQTFSNTDQASQFSKVFLLLVDLDLTGCLPFTQKIRKFQMECKMERLFLSPRTDIFSGKRDFLKGRPSEWKMCVPFANFY